MAFSGGSGNIAKGLFEALTLIATYDEVKIDKAKSVSTRQAGGILLINHNLLSLRCFSYPPHHSKNFVHWSGESVALVLLFITVVNQGDRKKLANIQNVSDTNQGYISTSGGSGSFHLQSRSRSGSACLVFSISPQLRRSHF